MRRHLRPPPTSHQGGQQKLLSRVYRPALPSLPLSPQSPVTEFSRLNALPPRRQLRARGKISRDFAVCRTGANVASLAPPSKNPETRHSENRTRHRASKLAPQEPPAVLHPPRHPTTNHPIAAATSSTSACCWLQLFGRICTGGKYFTPYELLSAGPVLSSEEIDRLFTALRGRGAAETGRMAEEGEGGGGRGGGAGALAYQIVCHQQ